MADKGIDTNSEQKKENKQNMEEKAQEKEKNTSEKEVAAKEKKTKKTATSKGKKTSKNTIPSNEPEKLKELEATIEGLNEKYLRLYSEFDNYRKRTIKEKIELGKTASEEVISEILPVVDDFERALKSQNNSDKDSESIFEGYRLIYNKLKKKLSSKGLEEMEVIGKEFNSDVHEAITKIPAPSEDMKGKIVDVTEKGYLLNGKVIRYAKVIIGE